MTLEAKNFIDKFTMDGEVPFEAAKRLAIISLESFLPDLTDCAECGGGKSYWKEIYDSIKAEEEINTCGYNLCGPDKCRLDEAKLSPMGFTDAPNEPIKRPPIGLIPKKLWLEDRLKALEDAISARINTDSLIPSEWIEERNWIIELLKSNGSPVTKD